MLLTLFYLHYVQCDDAHLFRGTSFSHTRTKKERLIHKKSTVTKDKKARKYTRLFVCRRYLFRERRLRKTLSLEKQIRYEHNFAPNGGYCVNCPSHNFCVFWSTGLLHRMFIFHCSLAQLYSKNKQLPSSVTGAKHSFILNSVLNGKNEITKLFFPFSSRFKCKAQSRSLAKDKL